MTDEPMLHSPAAIQEAAQKLQRIAHTMGQRRRRAFDNHEIDSEQSLAGARQEAHLVAEASLLHARAIELVIAGSGPSQAELRQAIDAANQKIADVAKFRQALLIFAAAVGLASAIMAAQPAGILKAVRDLKDSVLRPDAAV